MISVLVWAMGSTTFRLMRVLPSTGKKSQVMFRPDRASEIICPVLPPRIPRARLVLPSAATTLETLMPLPPGSVRMEVMRFTPSVVKEGISTVLSSAGFRVTV